MEQMNQNKDQGKGLIRLTNVKRLWSKIISGAPRALWLALLNLLAPGSTGYTGLSKVGHEAMDRREAALRAAWADHNRRNPRA